MRARRLLAAPVVVGLAVTIWAGTGGEAAAEVCRRANGTFSYDCSLQAPGKDKSSKSEPESSSGRDSGGSNGDGADDAGGSGSSGDGDGGSGGADAGGGCAQQATLRPLTPEGGTWGKVTTPAQGCETPAGRRPGPAQTTARELSRQAGARLPIPAPAVTTAPPKDTTMLIRLPTWFWLEDGHATSRSATARLDNVWARATATPYQLTLDPGDGSEPVTCDAPGIPYSSDHTPADAETACTHAYTDPGDYQVTAAVSWAADWTGSDGNGGTLPTLDRSTTFTLHVVEARSELIHGP